MYTEWTDATIEAMENNMIKEMEAHPIESAVREVYAEEDAITFIMEEKWLEDGTGMESVAGWYFGEPDEKKTAARLGHLEEVVEGYTAPADAWAVYAKGDDITFIMNAWEVQGSGRVSVNVVGWYWGEPNEEDTKYFEGSLVARY